MVSEMRITENTQPIQGGVIIIRTLILTFVLPVWLIAGGTTHADAAASFYGKSYALVIGIDKYPSKKWTSLGYAVKDAKGMEHFLKAQGFEVISLYNKHATRTNIISKMQSYIAPRLKKNDRVLIFYAGHGYTEHLGGKDFGYIVPHDGGSDSATYVSMETLQSQSSKMGNAKHQLFIMDACYSGLLGTRAGAVDEGRPDYLIEITRRTARQIITAGGKDQQVLDGGPDGHSFFTGYLLEGLEKGMADNNGDGYITFSELTSYVVPKATNPYQTPSYAMFPGHGLGEFVFASPRGATQRLKKSKISGKQKTRGSDEVPAFFEEEIEPSPPARERKPRPKPEMPEFTPPSF